MHSFCFSVIHKFYEFLRFQNAEISSFWWVFNYFFIHLKNVFIQENAVLDRNLQRLDNPVVGLFVLHKACDVKYLLFSLAGYEELARGLSQSEKEEYFELLYNKVLLLACIE